MFNDVKYSAVPLWLKYSAIQIRETWKQFKHAIVHKKLTVPTSDNFFRFNITSGLRLQYNKKNATALTFTSTPSHHKTDSSYFSNQLP